MRIYLCQVTLFLLESNTDSNVTCIREGLNVCRFNGVPHQRFTSLHISGGSDRSHDRVVPFFTLLLQATDREEDQLKYSIIRGNDKKDFTIDANMYVDKIALFLLMF